MAGYVFWVSTANSDFFALLFVIQAIINNKSEIDPKSSIESDFHLYYFIHTQKLLIIDLKSLFKFKNL